MGYKSPGKITNFISAKQISLDISRHFPIFQDYRILQAIFLLRGGAMTRKRSNLCKKYFLNKGISRLLRIAKLRCFSNSTTMKFFFTLMLAMVGLPCFASPATAILRVDRPGIPVPSTMYGIFFEDINFNADGGLYAEMIKNRSFEFPQNLLGWKSFGNVKPREAGGPFARNPHYLRLESCGHNAKYTGLENEGFFGISFRKDSVYRFSAWLRDPVGSGKIRVELCDPASLSETQVMASADIEVNCKEWNKYSVELCSSSSVDNGLTWRTRSTILLPLFLLLQRK